MKEIIFVRHAKSSWSHNVGDKERPLKNRGINDSHLVSSAFKKSKFIPNVIFTSPATRAKMTCEIFIQNLGFTEINKEIIDDIYDFGGNSLLNFIKSLDNSLNKVMIFHPERRYDGVFRTRVAGIQRLLSIIGYDVGNIDGVIGQKSAEALSEIGVQNKIFAFDLKAMYPVLEAMIAEQQKLDN